MVVMETVLRDGSIMLYTVDGVTPARLASSLGRIPRSEQSSSNRFATASFTVMQKSPLYENIGFSVAAYTHLRIHEHFDILSYGSERQSAHAFL